MTTIPLVDLKRQYKKIKPEIDAAIKRVIEDAAFVSPKYVKIFEEKFGRYCGAQHVIATGSGSHALFAAYAAIDLKRGDEVISVANTFTATIEPVYFWGAKPVFVDIDPRTYVINTSRIKKAITKKTRAIAVVHLYGQAAPMKKIMAIARKHNLKVIEDCSHAHGAMADGKMVGTWGDLGAYSFNPGKVVGAYGDAGCIVTNNDRYAEFIRMFINHGRQIKNKYIHDIYGLNLRMDGIQAAIISAKLDHINPWIKRRQAIAKKYTALLKDSVETPATIPHQTNSYHLYVIRTDQRDTLVEYLRSRGIEAGIHYPVPLHLQKTYAHLNLKTGMLPITEKISREILSLPMFAELTNPEIYRIAKEIKSFFRNRT